jgi:hypothetical protein
MSTGAIRYGRALVMSTSLIDECRRRAQEARRSAEMASMPSRKTHFLELEQRWLQAAASVTPGKVQEIAARVPPREVQETAASVEPGKVQETAVSVALGRVQEAAISLAPKAVQETRITRAEPRAANVAKGRPTKFTPERLEQIRKLVAVGKGRDEIAALLGATVGNLQVTCSRLGISLRRPRLNPQAELPKRKVPDIGAMNSPIGDHSVRFAFDDVDEVLEGLQQKDAAALRPCEIKDQEAGSASLLLTIEYRGRKRAIPLTLADDTISLLALEAQVREMSLGQLLGALLGAAMTKGLPRLLDGDARDRAA